MKRQARRPFTRRTPLDNRPDWATAPTIEFTEAERAEIWRLNGGRS